jgi:hypothetical protein
LLLLMLRRDIESPLAMAEAKNLPFVLAAG